MGVATVSPTKYKVLVAKALPKVIETDAEQQRFAEILESLDRLNRKFTPEEKAIADLLLKLIQDYDDKVEIPAGPPYRVVLHLMEQRNLRPVDMVPVFGSRSVASAVLLGKRELSKAHIRKLAAFFHVSPAAFLE